MQPGPADPVSSQQTGAITSPSVSPTTKSTSASPTTKSSGQSNIKKTSQSPTEKPGIETEPETVVVPANKVPVGAVVKNAKGKEVGVVVSPVGKKPRVDAVVLKDPKGKFTVADNQDKLIIDNPKYKKPEEPKDKKPAETPAPSQTIDATTKEDVDMNKRSNRLEQLNQFESLSLEEQLLLLDQIDKTKLDEAWSKKYKRSIDCNSPKGFSQKAHCAGRKARQAGKKTKSGSVSESVVHEDGVPDNSKLRHAKLLLAKPLLANDIKSQMDAYFIVPDPSMIKDFRLARASHGDTVDLRNIFKNYLKELHPKLKQDLNIRESKLNEYGSLDAAKQEILQAVSGIDTSTKDAEIAKKNAELLDKIYTILNKNNVMSRIQSVLPSVLKGEYSDKMIVTIAQELVNAPLTYQEKNDFADNLAKDKVIDAAILISPGIYTVDQLTNGDPVNRKVLDHLKSFGVGQQMKGPLEHALAILSHEISIAGKGDVTVAGEPVEIKAAVGEKKGSGGGRFGETGRLPSREQMLNIINGFEQMKPLMDQALATQKSLNISAFVTIANAANLDPQTRAQLGNKVFGTIFGAEAKPVIDAFNKPNADPDEVRKAYIVSNFNWYKNSDMGGEWKYLAAISLVDNSVGVVGTGEDLLRISAYKKNPAIITTDKPQEMLYQFNPKAM